MEMSEKLKFELDQDYKIMSSKIDLCLATIRQQLLELEIAKSDLRLKILKP